MEEYLARYQVLLKEADAQPAKPTLFLHACCGPCLTYPLSELVKHFQVTVGFFNPNIFPESEYEKRLQTLKDFIAAFSKKENVTVGLVVEKEDFVAYQKAFQDRFQDKEGGQSCLRCHAYRLGLSYAYAAAHGFSYFTTVMTVSCKKPSRELNVIAERLSAQYPQTRYLYSDFKKEDGQLKGIRLSREYGLYRQNYCGCEPSLLERKAYEAKKAQSLKDETMLG
jgi:epoxyqueuosine reductase